MVRARSDRAADKGATVTQEDLAKERSALIALARASQTNLGFGWLGDDGTVDGVRPRELWINCRMTHVLSLAALAGDDEARRAAEHGVAALNGAFRDAQFGGWFPAVDAKGQATATDKEAYGHAFVVLAAASAAAAGISGSSQLLTDGLEVMERFWLDSDGLYADVYGRDFTTLDPYRGANANMHSVEALLAAYSVTKNHTWLHRALSVTSRVVNEFAAHNEWRLPEHFTPKWQPIFDYNRAEPAHPFRPYGVTTGHLLEWSRLSLHLRSALGHDAPDWLLPAAIALFDRAVAEGWSGGADPGFVYTTDFAGAPVVTARLHWVVTEAIASAYALFAVTQEEKYWDLYNQWRALALEFYIDSDGSWRHELDENNGPAATVWTGRPDIYHAYQASLLPDLPFAESFVGGVLARA